MTVSNMHVELCFYIYHCSLLGGDSGRVVIWNMEPVVDEAAELDSNVPKMLCQLDNHLGITLFYCVFVYSFIFSLFFCTYQKLIWM